MLHAPAFGSRNSLSYLFCFLLRGYGHWRHTGLRPDQKAEESLYRHGPRLIPQCYPENVFFPAHFNSLCTLPWTCSKQWDEYNAEWRGGGSGCGTWYPAWLARSCGHASSPRVCLARATAAAATWARNRTQIFQLHNGCGLVTIPSVTKSSLIPHLLHTSGPLARE